MPETLENVAQLYGSMVTAPECTKPRNIKVAEAAKVIENTQRDLNIALMNELSMIFEQASGIDTQRGAQAAAGTKWNFLQI
jgi:UDP-N-acetyl-D-galactosamine dehydrogenase